MAHEEPRVATADELRDLANPYPGWSTERLQAAHLALRELVASKEMQK